MKSQKAKEFIDGCMAHLTVEMSDHAKWQLRAAMTHAAELAEQEMEGFYTCWIDPKDFMPEANKNVLVKFRPISMRLNWADSSSNTQPTPKSPAGAK